MKRAWFPSWVALTLLAGATWSVAQSSDVPPETAMEDGPTIEAKPAAEPLAEEIFLPTALNDDRQNMACSASTDCACGVQISCTGSWDCFASNGSYVECDGNRTNCPSGTCGVWIRCPNGAILECTGTCNNCSNGADWVICNGVEKRCSDPACQFFRFC